jgi:hypothetical protein
MNLLLCCILTLASLPAASETSFMGIRDIGYPVESQAAMKDQREGARYKMVHLDMLMQGEHNPCACRAKFPRTAERNHALTSLY